MKKKVNSFDTFEKFAMSVTLVVSCGDEMWVKCVYSVISLLWWCTLVTVCVCMCPVSAVEAFLV